GGAVALVGDDEGFALAVALGGRAQARADRRLEQRRRVRDTAMGEGGGERGHPERLLCDGRVGRRQPAHTRTGGTRTSASAARTATTASCGIRRARHAGWKTAPPA